jgi:TonB family protein
MRFIKYTLAGLILLLIIPGFAYSQEAAGPLHPAVPSAHSYPNTPEGLRLMLEDALVTARAGDLIQLESFTNQLEIPNYENWFPKAFGQEKGESWAEPYGRDLQNNERYIQALLRQFARSDGEILIRNVNGAPDPGLTVETEMVDALQQPMDIYLASWKSLGTPPDFGGYPIGYFVFIDGKFRWDSAVRPLRRQFATRPGSAGSGAFIPEPPTPGYNSSGNNGRITGPAQPGASAATYPICTYCPRPDYPQAEKAKHVEGTVVLQVIIQPDGYATDITVVKTPSQDFADKAIEAVEKWRFRPALDRDGQPVAAKEPIEVTFRLLN